MLRPAASRPPVVDRCMQLLAGRRLKFSSLLIRQVIDWLVCQYLKINVALGLGGRGYDDQYLRPHCWDAIC